MIVKPWMLADGEAAGEPASGVTVEPGEAFMFEGGEQAVGGGGGQSGAAGEFREAARAFREEFQQGEGAGEGLHEVAIGTAGFGLVFVKLHGAPSVLFGDRLPSTEY
jgi:hypothetical protein